MNFLRSVFDNDSVFGQLMTRCGTIIAANLLFLLFSIPVVTTGAAWTALHYTMMKMLREKEINPFKTFWNGFRTNWKQSTLAFTSAFFLLGILALEIFWCNQFTGFLSWFTYGLLAMALATVVLSVNLAAVMAAFNGDLKQHIQKSLYFTMHKPLDTILILAVHIVPMAVTYMDLQRMPLYAFLWFFLGFASVATFTDSLLLKQFTPFLDPDAHVLMQKTEQEILKEMKRLDF